MQSLSSTWTMATCTDAWSEARCDCVEVQAETERNGIREV
jgi:hypothetical protein